MGGSGGSAPAPPPPPGDSGSAAGGGGLGAPPPSVAAGNNALQGLYAVSLTVPLNLPARDFARQLHDDPAAFDNIVSLLLQSFNAATDTASKDAFKQIRMLAANVNAADPHPPDKVAVRYWVTTQLQKIEDLAGSVKPEDHETATTIWSSLHTRAFRTPPDERLPARPQGEDADGVQLPTASTRTTTTPPKPDSKKRLSDPTSSASAGPPPPKRQESSKLTARGLEQIRDRLQRKTLMQSVLGPQFELLAHLIALFACFPPGNASLALPPGLHDELLEAEIKTREAFRTFVRNFCTNEDDSFDIAVSLANSSKASLPADESALLSFGLTSDDLQAMSSAAKSGSAKPGKAASAGRCVRCNRNSHDAASCFATTWIDPATGKQTSLSPGIASSSLSRPDSAPAYVSPFDGLRRPPAVSFRHDSPPPPRYSSGYSSSRAAPSDYSSSRSSSGYSSSRASSYYGSHRGDSSHHHRGDRTNHRGDSYHQRSRY